MRVEYLVRKDSPKLLVFLAGWGMDPRPFDRLSSPAYDVLMLFDYRELGDLSLDLSAYQEIEVLAWSLGVSAALRSIEKISARRWIFLNGTGAFCHKGWGIHPRLMERTIKALKTRGEESLLAFYKNMFQGEEGLEEFLARRPSRPLEELITELEEASSWSPTFPKEDLRAVALVGEKDCIISPSAQETFWKEAKIPVKSLPFGHFPFYRFTYFEDILALAYERT